MGFALLVKPQGPYPKVAGPGSAAGRDQEELVKRADSALACCERPGCKGCPLYSQPKAAEPGA